MVKNKLKMSKVFYKMILRNLLFLLPPEIAHFLLIMALKKMPFKKPIELPESLNVNFFGNKLRSPVGLAAGFDKNAEVLRPMLSFGFGFIEAGTVTKYPQYGNKKPRIFRLIKDEGIINRLGFNNKGVDYFLKQISETKLDNCIFGINIGKNSTSKDQISDYVDLIKIVYGKSNYIVLNISSPNTPNLRDLHNKQELSKLLKSITLTKKSIDSSESIPIILKISPDIDQQTKENIAELVLEYKIDGLTVSNTTVSRDNLHFHHNESGGLSGKPLFKLSTELLSDMYKLTKGKILLIGCGGISSGADAYKKIKAGASLVQLYTALIYHGPQVVNKINLELAELIRRDGFSNISEVVGCIH
ncbi:MULTISPECIES: quinone-dependent dihydroorotate dehydrogenase [Wolbachia]|uniref:quinone-dependent dihydroorotate dehydrogenase n=1 Tax=Wolbachia TaxID=953 RepID=UPI001BAA227B|nr:MULTISPECIES: quinone-dependent dihydroorotate dehydrogenase [unclassified Wolbachia]QUI60206.1 quinone-dependent dihydroorotate dehydrogenase [Wolbachia endosymbiont of Spodoptera picta]URG40224.1 quinone-dependent dihydroorotate dehydrogenase [Wolbachia endosymbiont of Ostrinia furnacalis]URG41248.1 quinone-dependent dihydroorotate dehydrogenase [Wolbachia endosymbiont of Ostrinia scapulalis]